MTIKVVSSTNLELPSSLIKFCALFIYLFFHDALNLVLWGEKDLPTTLEA